MDVSFSSAALAELCNSEHQLAQRWGQQTGRLVARRLLDMAAADAEAVCRLPEAHVSANGTGEITITFGQEVVIRGVISNPDGAGHAVPTSADRILITSLHVHRSEKL
jgi:hypothetical protein